MGERVKNKVALITGAASGLGKADALALAREGASVVLTDVNEDGVLDNGDIVFLERVFADAGHVKHLAERHPEYQSLCAQVAHLYHQITERALENEQRQQRV